MAESPPPLTSNRPYLLRAIYEWLLDNNLTPQILVDAQLPGVQVPQQQVNDGQILFNVSPSAVTNLQMENDAVSFNARFSGTPMQIFVPSGAILAIFARENGQGMAFSVEEFIENQLMEEVVSEKEATSDEVEQQSQAKKNATKKTKPSLKIVK